MAKKQTKQTDKPKTRPRPVVNVDAGELAIPGDRLYSLAGIQSLMYTRLALLGLYGILRETKDREATFKSIMDGTYGNKERKFPPVILAIAKITGKEPSHISAIWASLSKKERLEYRRDIQIRAVVAEMALENTERLKDFAVFEQKPGEP